jgi:malonyl-CoA reductase/3-hydroxypropionate dehydrogenase (NADP+)
LSVIRKTASRARRSPSPIPSDGVARRLDGKIALVTGAAGNLGGEIVRRYLRAGAVVILTGRTAARLEAARAAALADTGAAQEAAVCVVMDGADPASVRAGFATIAAQFGRIDILVNNAGSAGPKQTIENLPLTAADLEAQRAAGGTDSETVPDAMRNIFGVTWNMMRAAEAILADGASVINVSTIFSRTPYFARSAYVVPKAALNALSREMARELGPRGVRVNLLFPGPIASERIRTVFAAMDGIRGDAPGTTESQMFGLMTLEREIDGTPRAKTYPTPADIAQTCVFLGSDESAAFNGADFEVTHGMAVPAESRSTLLARPSLRSVEGSGLAVLVSAGDQVDDAVTIALTHVDCGAKVLLGFSDPTAATAAKTRLEGHAAAKKITVSAFDRNDPAAMETTLSGFAAQAGPVTGAIVLPTLGVDRLSSPLIAASDQDTDLFIDAELVGALAVARTLARYWSGLPAEARAPRFVFMSNPAGGPGGGAYAQMLSAAVEQLTRIWRDEAATAFRKGRLATAPWGNQIVRHGNAERENAPFAAAQAARILMKDQCIPDINLKLPECIEAATGARKAVAGFSETIAGLHLGKIALITGGSAGIGGQVARLLALAGAKVMIVARREDELAAARARIVSELADVGYARAESRVQALAGVDVSDAAALRRAFDATLEAYGRIDYVINNAGISGAEEMVVDMSVDAWRHTLKANLISNYALTQMAVPLMKSQGSGYVLNVSSFFGGEKYLAVAYPNRADYAVSKAGQRALVESLARFLGPEIQINAIAPGPVDGDRLAGVAGRPGLFDRRGRLILENKRLNAIYEATVKAMRRGVRVEAILNRLSRNDIIRMSHITDNPKELRDLALKCARDGEDGCSWGLYLMTEAIAQRLVARLRLAGYFLDCPAWAERPDGGWLLRLPPEDKPWLSQARMAEEARKVGQGVLSLLNLGKMPTEAEVAQATVFFLADRAVSGETFMPSGGLTLERSTTERELFGGPKQERLDQMRGRTVWLIGEHLVDYIAEAARDFVEQCHVARVVLMVGTADGEAALRAALADLPPGVVEVLICGDDIESAMDLAKAQWAPPTTVVSTPMSPLPDALFGTDAPLDEAGFTALVEANLTQHFRVSRKASLYDAVQLVIVSPDVPHLHKGPAFALANFVKTTLHAFTATLAVENERLVHDVPVNQINLTRRVRSEEPRDQDEHLEEVKRFARAVLLLGAPLPDHEDSRYRARIYRGMSMTV